MVLHFDLGLGADKHGVAAINLAITLEVLRTVRIKVFICMGIIVLAKEEQYHCEHRKKILEKRFCSMHSLIRLLANTSIKCVGREAAMSVNRIKLTEFYPFRLMLSLSAFSAFSSSVCYITLVSS